jgi:hypothetical protein
MKAKGKRFSADLPRERRALARRELKTSGQKRIFGHAFPWCVIIGRHGEAEGVGSGAEDSGEQCAGVFGQERLELGTSIRIEEDQFTAVGWEQIVEFGDDGGVLTVKSMRDWKVRKGGEPESFPF